MIAIPKDNTYPDLQPNQEYEIERVIGNQYIIFKGSQRRYRLKHFKVMNNGKKINYDDVYRRYKLEVVKRKLGI